LLFGTDLCQLQAITHATGNKKMYCYQYDSHQYKIKATGNYLYLPAEVRQLQQAQYAAGEE
jgi:hypothetical protein